MKKLTKLNLETLKALSNTGKATAVGGIGTGDKPATMACPP